MTTQNPMSMGLDYARSLATTGGQIQQRQGMQQQQDITAQNQERLGVEQTRIDQQNQQLEAANRAKGINSLAQGMLNLPYEQRMQALMQQQESLTAMGLDVSQLTEETVTDDGLNQIIQMTGGIESEKNAPDSPSAVREWEYYSSLKTPEEKQQYLNVKRANQIYKSGDVDMILDPVQGGSSVIVPTGAPPTTQPEAQTVLSNQESLKQSGITAANQAIKLSGEAFDKLGTIRQAIPNLDEAMLLVDQGAKTGPVVSKLPSVQQASMELDNLQGRLGLDVIGNTTFGALSADEVKFALNVALPKNLKGPALKAWLQRKKDSQVKLADYLEEAAIFLGTPGNTVADFLAEKKAASADITTMSDDDLMNF